jgi:DNA-binding response OmpR family regulator
MKGHILIVDDNFKNIQVLGNILREQGFDIAVATNGDEALDWVKTEKFDLILLDIMMPGMDGYAVCDTLKKSEKTKHIPVIFLTAKTDSESIVKGFELGGVDYITKPFNVSELISRVKTHVELKRTREDLIEAYNQLGMERDKSEKLLLNILPQKVANELKESGYSIPEKFENVTVLFTDFVNFTSISSHVDPNLLINELNELFTAFDEIMDKYDCERIKTIGDAYLAVCGLPTVNVRHVENIIYAAIDILNFLKERNTEAIKNNKLIWEIRIGIHTGAVVAGLVGIRKYIYDVFGDTVNIASRMESLCEPMKINISESTYKSILRETYGQKLPFIIEERNPIDVKGKGSMKMYFIVN